jgi:hypothetical protein
VRFALTFVTLSLALSACGPKTDPGAEPPKPKAKSGVALPTGPVLSGVGVIAGLEGTVLTLDHEAVEGGRPAGRDVFAADAAVLAEAPLAPGTRVAFSYQDWTPRPLLTELKSR